MISLAENNKQEAEQQVQESSSENVSGDRVEENHPSESNDETSEKESKKAEEETRETGADLGGADKVKAESAPSEAPRIANNLTEEPEAQEQSKKPERVDEAPAPVTISRTSSVAQEQQAPARPTPLYWRRLTARYMSVGPQPS